MNIREHEINVLVDAVREAGAAILQMQEMGFSIEKKANNDIVTQADLLANNILRSRLSSEFPTYGWLSEESCDDHERLQCEKVWVVDPIDGTKEFATHIPEYAISVALVESGMPIVACVYNPASDEFFHASKDEGAWLNGEPMQCASPVSQQETLLLASRSEYQRGEWARFERLYTVKVVGSIAYKLARVAAGKAQATFSLGPKNEWDIAAGVLLVSEAGGVVTDVRGETFLFNRERVLVDGIVASEASVSDVIFDMIRA